MSNELNSNSKFKSDDRLQACDQTEKHMQRQIIKARQEAADEAAALLNIYTDREKQHDKQLVFMQEALSRLMEEATARDKVLTQKISQSSHELNSLLHSLARREQEFGERLFASQQHAASDKAELLRLHAEKEKAFQLLLIQREDALRQEQNQHLQALQKRFDDSLAHHQQQHERFRQSAAVFEKHLKQQIQAEQQVVSQLRQTLSKLLQELDSMRSSFSWWLTAPLRKLVGQLGAAEAPIDCSFPTVALPTKNLDQDPAASKVKLLNQDNQMIPFTREYMSTNTSHKNMIAAKNIDELLSYHDEQFVRCAYLSLLGRNPDPDGMNYYLMRVRKGISKIEIIVQLYNSSEAKSRYPISVDGLNVAVTRYKWLKIPIVGSLFRIVGFCNVDDISFKQQLRIIENKLAINFEQLSGFCKLESKVDGLCEEMKMRSDQFNQSLSSLSHLAAKHTNTINTISQRLRSANNIEMPLEYESTELIKACNTQTVKTPMSSGINDGVKLNIIVYYYVDHTILCSTNTGMQRVTRRLADALVKHDYNIIFIKWDVTVKQFVYIDKDELNYLGKWNGPIVKETSLAIYPDAGQMRVIVPSYEPWEENWLVVPEVTHITFHPIPMTLDILTSAKSLGLKTAFIFYDAIPLRRSEFKEMSTTHAEYMQHLLLADLIVPISNWSSVDLVAYLKLSEHAKLAPTPHIRPLQLPGESQLSPRITSVSTVNSDNKFILSVGSIVPHKNQISLVHAFNRYCINYPDTAWKLRIVGNLHPVLSDELIGITSNNNKIIYLGDVSDTELDSLYRECTFTIFPSVMEGFGLPILESLWYAKPCVCANFGAMAEVSAGGGCVTIDTRDENQIYESISGLIEHPDRLAELSFEATKRHIGSWEEYSFEFYRMLEEISSPLSGLGYVYYWVDHTSVYPANSGIQRVVRGLARAMLGIGIKLIPVKWDEDARTIYPANENELRHLEKWNGPSMSLWSDWIPFESSSPRDWLLVPELTHYLNNTTPDHIQVFSKENNLRCAWIFHDSIPWKYPHFYPLEATEAHKRYMLAMNNFEKVFPNSNTSSYDLMSFLTSVHPKPGYIDDRLNTCLLPGEFLGYERILTTKMPNSDQIVRILVVGTVEPRKNHILLLEAIHLLRKETSVQFELVIAGRDSYPDLARQIQQYVDSIPGVVWLRNIDDSDLMKLYSECDFTVFASLAEGFGLPILESLWSARPCVCANYGAMAEIAEGGGCLMVDVSDKRKLATGIRLLVEDDVLRKKLGDQAVARNFKTWQDYAYEIATHLAEERKIVIEPQLSTKYHEIEQHYNELINIEKRPYLSICISTYNRAAWLSLNLKNLFRILPFPSSEIEIVVCDNTSTDETPEVVIPYLNRSDFRYYRNPENVGMLGNLRVTAHHARGEYIWILGDDDIIKPDSIEHIVNVIKTNSGVALIYLNYAYTRQEDASAVTDIEEFINDSTPITSPTPDWQAPVQQICTQSENFFTAIYCLVFRRDHALRAYSQNTNGRPFSTMLTCIPTTYHVLNSMMSEPAYWIGEPQLVVNLNVSWMKYAPLWILERIPEVYDLAEKLGADSHLVDKWRVNNMPGVLHFFQQIYADDPEGNGEYFSVTRLINRLKHLEEFREILPKLRETYETAHRSGNPLALLPVDQIFIL